VIIFYSLLPDGTGDQKSLHGACPVGHGQKWAANKWIWNQPFVREK
jgi:prolyl 4-hydroxylase